MCECVWVWEFVCVTMCACGWFVWMCKHVCLNVCIYVVCVCHSVCVHDNTLCSIPVKYLALAGQCAVYCLQRTQRNPFDLNAETTTPSALHKHWVMWATVKPLDPPFTFYFSTEALWCRNMGFVFISITTQIHFLWCLTILFHERYNDRLFFGKYRCFVSSEMILLLMWLFLWL